MLSPIVTKPLLGVLAFSLRLPPTVRMTDTVSQIAQTFPFISNDALLAKDVLYSGFGQRTRGIESYPGPALSQHLASRLQGFRISDKVVLPPDSRRRISARYTVAFEAPVPLQVLPAQRRRVADANLTLTPAGLLPVEARVACTIDLDERGLITRHTEAIAVDPFAVTATVAHYNLLFERKMCTTIGEKRASALDVAAGWWVALRELTRQELNEVVSRERRESDELRVLGDTDDLSDGEFERWFAIFIGRNFLVGGLGGAALYGVLRALKEGTAAIS